MIQASYPVARRAFLAKSADAGVRIGNVATAAEQFLDAELIHLGGELERAWAAEDATYAACYGLCSNEADDRCHAASAATGNIVDRIGVIPATTIYGLRVKAKAISWCHSGEPFVDTSLNEQATTDVRIASSILRDLLALTEA